MKNTTKYGIGALVLLVAGYFLYSKNKKITSLPATLPAPTEPVKIDREKIAKDYAQSQFDKIKEANLSQQMNSGMQIQSTGLQVLNGGVKPNTKPLIQPSLLSMYESMLNFLNQITDDNDVILYMKYLQEKPRDFSSLDGQIFYKNFTKKYPNIKID